MSDYGLLAPAIHARWSRHVRRRAKVRAYAAAVNGSDPVSPEYTLRACDVPQFLVKENVISGDCCRALEFEAMSPQ
jgi:hypothetical protein